MPSAGPAPKTILWQLPMQRVLYALIPAAGAAVYYFGWRSLVLLVLVNAAAFGCEYLFVRTRREPVSSAVFVTATLYTLTLPPSMPYWMALVGIAAGVVFGKMVFGGFGRNIFNPALVGRAFVYVAFPQAMTGSWVQPFSGALKGLAGYAPDTVSGATPLSVLSGGGTIPVADLLLGNTAGCLGETAALLLIIGGVYLIVKKTANAQIVLACLAGYGMLHTALWAAGLTGGLDPLRAFLSGGFMLGAFFMATDPVSAGQTTVTGRILYGSFIGVVTVIIRTFSIWPEGMMFAILLGNMFSPITEYALKQAAARKKEHAA